MKKYPRQLSAGATNAVIGLAEIKVALEAEMLVMERLRPFDFRAHEVEIRALWLVVFEDGLRALHRAGFVHRDLKRPSDPGGLAFDNRLLTQNSLRSIGVGISALQKQAGDAIFEKHRTIEEGEMAEFRAYFLNR